MFQTASMDFEMPESKTPMFTGSHKPMIGGGKHWCKPSVGHSPTIAAQPGVEQSIPRYNHAIIRQLRGLCYACDRPLGLIPMMTQQIAGVRS